FESGTGPPHSNSGLLLCALHRERGAFSTSFRLNNGSVDQRYSRQCGPGFFPSRQPWRRYISSPQVELHSAEKSLATFQPACVNRSIVAPSSLEMFQVSVVPSHPG